MAQVVGGSNMMAGIKTDGCADSGFGITLAGFHGPAVEFGMRLSDLEKKLGAFTDIAQWEDNGYVLFLASKREGYAIPESKWTATFRREPHKFFIDLPAWLSKTRAQFIDRMVLSGSLGSVSLTILYRPALSV